MDSHILRRPQGLRLALSPVPVLVLSLALGICPAFAQTSLSLERAVADAAARSPLVSASDSQARAAREMAVAAGQLPDPVLKLGYGGSEPVGVEGRAHLTFGFFIMTVEMIHSSCKALSRRMANDGDYLRALCGRRHTSVPSGVSLENL